MSTTADYSPKNPYTEGLKQLRAAATAGESFEEQRYKAERMRALMATREALDAAEAPTPRLTAAQLSEFAPPDIYAAGLAALRAKERK